MTALITALLLAQGLQPTSYVGIEALDPFGPHSDQPVLSLPFSTPGCYASGVGGVSISRATPATYESAPGVYTSCAAGSYRVEAKGLLVESQRVNNIFWSGGLVSGTTLGTSWLAIGAPAYSTQGVSPDGAGVWARIQSGSVGDVVYQSRVVASTTAVTASVWARADTGTDTPSIQAGCAAGTNTACTCGRSDGGSTTARPGVTLSYHCTCDANNITTTPVRIWATATCGGATTTATLAITPGSYNSAVGTTEFWGAQLENNFLPTSYIPTTTAGVTRNADIVSITTPLTVDDFNDGYCIGFRSEPFGGGAWNVPASRYFVLNGTVAAANELRIQTGAASTTYFVEKDGGGIERLRQAASQPAGSAAHDFLFYGGTGNPALKIDGVEYGSTTGISWSGRSAIAGTTYLGASAAGSSPLDGYLKNFRIYRNASCR